MSRYPWYEVVSSDTPLQQGDFLIDCPILLPKGPMVQGEQWEVDAEVYEVVIMTQSCDLALDKVEIVLVAPVVDYEELQADAANQYLRGRDGKKRLRQGNIVALHLLNKCDLEDAEKAFRVVDFRKAFGVDYGWLKHHAASQGSRLRLLPPYREHLAQVFARFLMRVGLPQDIEGFD